MMITLQEMTLSLCRRFYKKFENDPAVYADPAECKAFEYTEANVERYFQRQLQHDRKYLAVMLNAEPIGEIILKHINWDAQYCTLSIHLQNDSVKGKGYGTAAEKLAVQYAFCQLHMETVYANALVANTRSRHVLEKAGFTQTHQDAQYAYFKYSRL